MTLETLAVAAVSDTAQQLTVAATMPGVTGAVSAPSRDANRYAESTVGNPDAAPTSAVCRGELGTSAARTIKISALSNSGPR